MVLKSIAMNIPETLIAKVDAIVGTEAENFPTRSAAVRAILDIYLTECETQQSNKKIVGISIDLETQARIMALGAFSSVSDFVRSAIREVDFAQLEYHDEKWQRVPWGMHDGKITYRQIKTFRCKNPSKMWSKLALNFIEEKFGVVVAENSREKASWNQL